jgi:hypothetical protein
MPNFKGQFFSIVLIGRHNPQILNHDFLINNEIIPVKDEPFKSIIAREDSKPFTEFISTPVLATIKYDSISIVVEDNRYQIKDGNYGDPTSSSIIQITRSYFGEVLKYTPLTLGGINLNGIITFKNEKGEQRFDENLGINRKNLCAYAGTADVMFGMDFSFPWLEGMVAVQIPKQRDHSKSCTINFNYEFKHDNMKSFLVNLDKVEQIHGKFRELLQSLGVEESV